MLEASRIGKIRGASRVDPATNVIKIWKDVADLHPLRASHVKLDSHAPDGCCVNHIQMQTGQSSQNNSFLHPTLKTGESKKLFAFLKIILFHFTKLNT